MANLNNTIVNGILRVPTAKITTLDSGIINVSEDIVGTAANLTAGTAVGYSAGGGIATALGTKAPIASPTFTGTVKMPFSSAGFVKIKDTTGELIVDTTVYAPLASPNFTGTPTAPTASSGTNNTQIATTAFVKSQGYVTTDTKNTAGSTNSTGKLFLVGSSSQEVNPVTYSNTNVYATDGALTATSFSGSGVNLTSLNASNITSGTLDNEVIPSTISGDKTFTGVTIFKNILKTQDSNGIDILYTDPTGTEKGLYIKNSGTVKITLSQNGTVTATTFKGAATDYSADGEIATALNSKVDNSRVGAAAIGDVAGIATLDATGKLTSGQIPDYLLGQLLYGGTIGSDGVCSLTNKFISKYGRSSLTITVNQSNIYEGAYFIASGDGTLSASTSGAVSYPAISYSVGDWIVSNGDSGYKKIDNTDAVTGVTVYKKDGTISSGSTGNVVVNVTNLGLENVDNTSDNNKPVSAATQTAINAVDNSAVHKTGDETISGTKIFSSNIVGNLSGNASTATSATTANSATTATDYSSTGGIATALDTKAPIVNPTFTGTVTAPKFKATDTGEGFSGAGTGLTGTASNLTVGKSINSDKISQSEISDSTIYPLLSSDLATNGWSAITDSRYGNVKALTGVSATGSGNLSSVNMTASENISADKVVVSGTVSSPQSYMSYDYTASAIVFNIA